MQILGRIRSLFKAHKPVPAPVLLSPDEEPQETDDERHFICPDCGEFLNTRRQYEEPVRLYFCRNSGSGRIGRVAYGNTGCGAAFRHHFKLVGEPWERIVIEKPRD